jgi:HAD superfamily hydrolase (TIGR01509 family)
MASETREMQSVKAFVFDCFGVLSSEVAPLVLEAHLPPPVVRAVKDTIIMDADRGAISQAVMFEKLSAVLGISPRHVEDEYWSRVHIDRGVVEIIEKLRASYAVGFLSNSPAQFIRDILVRNDLNVLFDTIMISGVEGLIKPDPAIFKRMMERMSIDPHDGVMIDDKPRNIEGARAAGMDGVVFESAEKLARDLTTLYSVTL